MIGVLLLEFYDRLFFPCENTHEFLSLYFSKENMLFLYRIN